MEILSSYKVNELYNSRDIIFLMPDDSIFKALQILGENNIYSAPVLLLDREPMITGFVDLFDILEFSIKFFNDMENCGNVCFETFLEYSEALSSTKIGAILLSSERNSVKVINDESNIKEAIKHLIDYDVKRLLIVNNRNKIQNVITQSSVVDFLWKNNALIQEYLNKTLSDFNSYMQNIMTVSLDDKVINAFKLMKESNISAICVVDEEFNLVGTISLKDLRIMIKGLTFMQRLYMSIKEYLRTMEEYAAKDYRSITCSKDHSLRDILKKLHDNKVHRVWVVEDNKPIDVVSLKDFLEIMYNFA